MIVFGGYDGTNALDETWVLSLQDAPQWQRLDLAGPRPAARWGHGAVYDPAGDRMIVFGGANDSTTLDDTWQLAFAGTPAWSPLPTSTRPPARQLACMSLDPVHQCLVLLREPLREPRDAKI